VVAELVAAVDVGGTRVKAALVDRDGTELVATTRATPGGLGRPGALTDAVVATVAELQAGREPGEVLACGLVVPGIVDDESGTAVFASNLGWRDLPVREPLERELGVPVALGHDVRAGLLAESEWGAARGARHALFLPLGTGIAGALMLDGHVISADGWSGELGHVVVDPEGRPCPCGGRGCLETIASASAVARSYAERSTAAAPVPSAAAPLAPATPLDAEGVAGLVRRGDPVAAAVWDDAVGALARVIVMVVTATGLDLVLLGGGLAQSGDLLLDPLRRRVHESLSFQREPRITRAVLGDRAGCLGAARLAWGLR
jgi:glucokinase